MELKQYGTILRSRLWMLLLLVLVGAAATGVYSYSFAAKTYLAETKLIVNQKQGMSEQEQLDLGTINSNIRLVTTYKEIIQSPRIMALLAERYPELGLTPEELAGRIAVTAADESQVMTLVAADSSYRQAAEVVNALAAVFQNEIPKLMNIDNVIILSEANPADTPPPVSPRPQLNIMIGIVLSLMAGVGLAFLLDYMDDTIKTEEDVRQVLGIPAYSAIPRYAVRNKRAKRQQELRSAGGEKNVTLEL